MRNDELKKLKSKKPKKNKSKALRISDVKNAEKDLLDDSLDLLNEEVWEYMNEQDDQWLF